MSYSKSKYVDDSLMEDVFNKLNRLGKYASRQELLDEIRDLNLDLEREKKMLETYRHRYEAKQGESFSLTKNLDSVKEYQGSLMKEHKELEQKYEQLKKQNEHQKTDIQVLKKELDSKELSYFLNRRRFMDTLHDDRWLREHDLERSSGSKYKYWHWRPWLYRHYRDLYDKYYPSTSYDPSWYYTPSPYSPSSASASAYVSSPYYPYYSSLYRYPYSSYYSKYSWPYYSSYLAGSGYYSGLDTTATSGDWTLRRKWDLEDKMSSIQRMTDDLKLNNYRMLKDLKSVKSAIDL
ncbi:uncharacterized protein LOC134853346 isoform X2 [Symsagittifera roscoffensis]|uniref:uncharacterized protein LOC134853346 isoform X2 n=1 Tax=Symsagittifera roscoffensis TaxID=84072 RepID=UPI00307B79EF